MTPRLHTCTGFLFAKPEAPNTLDSLVTRLSKPQFPSLDSKQRLNLARGRMYSRARLETEQHFSQHSRVYILV